MKLRLPLVLASLLLSAFAFSSAQGATYYWNGKSDSFIHTNANWWTTPAGTESPTDGWAALWSGNATNVISVIAGAPQKNITIQFNTLSIAGIDVAEGAGGYTLAAAGSRGVNFRANGASGKTEFNIKDNFSMGSSGIPLTNLSFNVSADFNIAAGKTMTVWGVMAGTAAQTITLKGGGALALQVAAATSAVAWNIEGGILNPMIAEAMGTGTLTVAGGTVNMTTAQNIGNTTLTSGLITLSGAGTLGAADKTITVNGGTLKLLDTANLASTGAVTVNAGGTLEFAKSPQAGNFGGRVTLNGGKVLFSAGVESAAASQLNVTLTDGTTNTFDVATGVNASFSSTGANMILTGSGDIIKAGAGALALSAASAGFTGDTTVQAGSLLLGNSSALGNSGTLTLMADTVLASYNANNGITVNNELFVSGKAKIGTGVGGVATGVLNFAKNINVATGTSLTFQNNASISASLLGEGTIVTAENVVLTLNLGSGTDVGFVGNGGTTTDAGTLSLTLGKNSELNYLGGGAQYIDGLATTTVSSINYNNNRALMLFVGDLNVNAANALNLEGYNFANANYIQLDSNDFTAEDIGKKLAGVWIRDIDGTLKEATINKLYRLAIWSEVLVDNVLLDNTEANNPANVHYSGNDVYFGASQVGVDYGVPFTFTAASTDPDYRFTVGDSPYTGATGNSFSVSALLADTSNDGGGDVLSRGLTLIGGRNFTERELTLRNGANSFTGDVSVSEATLRLAADAGTIANSANVTLMGTGNEVTLQASSKLIFATGAGNETYTYQQKINFASSGAASLVQENNTGAHTLSGVIALMGAGTYTISNLALNNSLTLGGQILANGGGLFTSALNNTLIFDAGEAADGSGKIVLTSAGSLLNKMVVGGYVELAQGASLSAQGIVFSQDNAYLGVERATLSVGAGGLGVDQTTSSILSLNTGTLQATSSFTSAAAIAFNVAGLSKFDLGGSDVTIEGVISNGDTSVLTKTGAGKLTLTGNLAMQGALNSTQGDLVIGKAGSDATIKTLDVAEGKLVITEGATLRTENLTLNNNSELSGAGSIVTDLITFGAGSRFTSSFSGQTWQANFKEGSMMKGRLLGHRNTVNFAAGSQIYANVSLPDSVTSGQITTAGVGNTIRFNGAIVRPDEEGSGSPALDWTVGKTYSFVLASAEAGLLNKEGQRLTDSNMAGSVDLLSPTWNNFLTADLRVSKSTLYIDLLRNADATVNYAQTSNQYAVAAVIDYVWNNRASLQLEGTELGNMANMFAVAQDLASFAPKHLEMLGGLTNYQSFAGQRIDLLRHGQSVAQRAKAGMRMASYSHVEDNQFWVEGTQSYNEIDSCGNAPGYKATSYGAALGLDFLTFKYSSFGAAFAYSNMKTTARDFDAESKADNYYVDLYGRWEKDAWSGSLTLTAAQGDLTIERTGMYDLLPNKKNDPLVHTAKGSTKSSAFLAQADVGYDFVINEQNRTVQPFLRASAGQLTMDSYTESGLNNGGLSVDEQKNTVMQLAYGVRMFQSYIDKYEECETARWELRAEIVHDLGDRDYTVNSHFIGAPAMPFKTKGVEVDSVGAMIGGGFNKALDRQWSVFADVNGEFRNSSVGMSSSLGLRCTF